MSKKKANIALGIGALSLFLASRKKGSRSIIMQTMKNLQEVAKLNQFLLVSLADKLKKAIEDLEKWAEDNPEAVEWDGDQLTWSQIKNIPLPKYTKILGYSSLAEYHQALKEVQISGFESVRQAMDYGRKLSDQQVQLSEHIELPIIQTSWAQTPDKDIVMSALIEPIDYYNDLADKGQQAIDKALDDLERIANNQSRSLTLLDGGQ